MIKIDTENATVTVEKDGQETSWPMQSKEAFAAVSDAWVRCGWDTKQVYSFSWMGRPIIQLPEDMVRSQEAIYAIRPDVIIETGVAHGGSLIFYASLLHAMGNNGRIVGVDIEIRPHNRSAIEAHEMFPYITLIEGSSVDAGIVDQVRAEVKPDDTVLILLDSNHTKEHVLAELEAYAPMVTPGSYIVVADGIMEKVVGGPRTEPDWQWNNPRQAVLEFVENNEAYAIEPPAFPFNEGMVTEAVTYWPDGWVKRLR
ncbi:MAG: cephalosporin hydroxylase family protein [Proteobacteria bacterium]|nr:cephalosporin hydroxylase family protein [Pseudomonadota bacterium]